MQELKTWPELLGRSDVIAEKNSMHSTLAPAANLLKHTGGPV